MHYRLSFNGQIFERQANALRDRTAAILERPDYESLTILFASEGGSTDHALSLYNFIQALPVPIHMHAMGHVGSSAIPVFLGGHERTCTPFSRFFFHAYDWGFEGRQMVDRIAEALQRLESDIQLARQIVQRHTRLSDDDLNRFSQKTPTPTILTPEQAHAVGVVSHIQQLGTAAHTTMWTVNWTSFASVRGRRWMA